MPKVLLINGSPHDNGCIGTALAEMKKIFDTEKVDVEIIHIGNKPVRGCV